MIREFFGLLKNKFRATFLLYGSLIDQKNMIRELKENRGDWTYKGTDAGKAIAITARPTSPYPARIRREVTDGYARRIRPAVSTCRSSVSAAGGFWPARGN